jgi:hypothetical protein
VRIAKRSIATIVLGSVVLAACGGGSGGTTGPQSQAPSSATSSAPSAAPSDGGQPSAAASTEPTPAASAGGGAATGVCELVTPDEIAPLLGVPSVTMNVLAGVGGSDTCDIQSDGAAVAAFVLTRSDPASGLDVSFVFSAYASSDATAVAGIGDKAAYSSSQEVLLVLKGDGLISIAVFDDAKSAPERLEVMKQIGMIAAGRM